MMRTLSALMVLLCFFSFGFAQKSSVIPEPASSQLSRGKFLNIGKIRFSCPAEQEVLVQNFSKQLAELGAKPIQTTKSGEKSANLVIVLDTRKVKGDEAYLLNISDKQIRITASASAGLFYGLQSLLQMALTNPTTSGFQVPQGAVQDSPRYPWRGMMLDESRHFFGKAKVKQLLDWMAFYKLNKFHWHLTDEPAWRIEIKKYPKLTSVGGAGTYVNPNAPVAFYTQNDVKEIVAYAAERYIEVIPEIDMPGHATAANRAYPEFSGGGSERNPEFTFNPGKEGTYSYLTDILREVAQLFPSRYIHLGGDEVHYGNQQWNTMPDIQALMKKHQLKDLQAVEFYFVNRMADSISALKKTVIGWDEIVTSEVPNDKSMVMWWRHDKPGQLKLALEKGYQTVLCPRIPFYFDFVQYAGHQSGRYWDKDFASIEKILAFDELYGSLIEGHPDLVRGIQANVWTETIHTGERLDYMIYPRIAALAEMAWSPKKMTDSHEFVQRLQPSLNWYKAKGISFFNPENPESTPEIKGVKK